MLINLKYFQADQDELPIESELPFELKGTEYSLQCKFCGTKNGCMPLTKNTFSRDGEKIVELNSYEKGVGICTQYACLDCLRKRKYEYRHKTELGILRESGFTALDHHTGHYKMIEQPSQISQESIEELRITPPFRAWQGPCWLTHCNDFMTYLGIWRFDDFKKNSTDGNAFNYFVQITPKGTAPNYDLDPDTSTDEDFHEMLHGEFAEATCYAFRCVHCNSYKVILDNP